MLRPNHRRYFLQTASAESPNERAVSGACLRRFSLLAFSVLALIFGSLHAQAADSELRLPALLSDHMVLQSGKAAALWGWSKPAAAVKVEFLDGQGKVLASASGTAAAEGRWAIKLPALPPSTSGTLRFTAAGVSKTVQDVLVGEVWLGGGQSNMSYTLSALNSKMVPDALRKEILGTAEQEVTAAKGAIRFFIAGGGSAVSPAEDVKGQWFVVAPDNYQRCSAVAWNFAVALHEKLAAPVGMIVSAVGGTSVTLWMPKAALDACPHGPEVEQGILKQIAQSGEGIKKYELAEAAWLRANPTPKLQAQNIKSRPTKPRQPPMFSELYNGMIHGLEPYTIKGVIWFQADGDMGRAFFYGELIQGLIKAWRASWQEELPFYYVEMNNMREMTPKDPPQGNDSLSILRQQQQAALELPQTDVACSIDVRLLGTDPHFPDKKAVGQRLALLAFNNVYGLPCAAHSPAYESFTVEGNKIRLHFKYAEGLRVRGGGEPIGFEIRGAAGKWVWAQGCVDGQEIVVWNDQIPHPTEVHYAWSMNPPISMENGAGLPMRPFSTTVIKP
jgi:sialate O-acetylesterase